MTKNTKVSPPGYVAPRRHASKAVIAGCLVSLAGVVPAAWGQTAVAPGAAGRVTGAPAGAAAGAAGFGGLSVGALAAIGAGVVAVQAVAAGVSPSNSNKGAAPTVGITPSAGTIPNTNPAATTPTASTSNSNNGTAPSAGATPAVNPVATPAATTSTSSNNSGTASSATTTPATNPVATTASTTSTSSSNSGTASSTGTTPATNPVATTASTTSTSSSNSGAASSAATTPATNPVATTASTTSTSSNNSGTASSATKTAQFNALVSSGALIPDSHKPGVWNISNQATRGDVATMLSLAWNNVQVTKVNKTDLINALSAEQILDTFIPALALDKDVHVADLEKIVQPLTTQNASDHHSNMQSGVANEILLQGQVTLAALQPDSFPDITSGFITPASNLPTNLTATYNGVVSGTLTNATPISGTLSMTVNFANLNLIPGAVTFNNGLGNANFNLAGAGGPMGIVGTFTSGTFGNQPVSGGNISGSFFGQSANEAGGTFQLKNNSNTNTAATGTFAAKR